MKLETKHLKITADVPKPSKDFWQQWAVFLLIPLHLFLYFIQFQNSAELFFLICILIFAADFVLSFLNLSIVSERRSKIGIFCRDYLPYLGKKALICAVDFVIYLILDRTQHHAFDFIDSEQLWLGICVATTVFAALVVFVTGVTCTVLWHDQK